MKIEIEWHRESLCGSSKFASHEGDQRERGSIPAARAVEERERAGKKYESEKGRKPEMTKNGKEFKLRLHSRSKKVMLEKNNAGQSYAVRMQSCE